MPKTNTAPKARNISSGSADDPIIRRKTAAQYVGLSEPAFDRLVRSGNGPKVIKVGRAVGSRRSWLNSYLDSLEQAGE